MDTAGFVLFRLSPSRRFLTSSFCGLPPNRASPPSIHLRGYVPRRIPTICLPSLAVTVYAPAVTNDYLQESTSSSSVAKENSSEDENGSQDKESEDDKDEQMNEIKIIKVCDKLIEIFLVDKPNPSDWRKLLVFSKSWSEYEPHFYNRCQERADTESDPAMKLKLLKLSRRLKEVNDDVKRHNELLEVIKKNPSKITSIISRRRKDFTEEFFIHFRDVADSYYYQNPEKRDDMIKMGKACLAAVKSYDNVSGNIEGVKLKEAELKFNDLINSPNLDIGLRKIDDLAKKKQLDSPFMMMRNKAWSQAKETTLVKDEAKDMMFSLYKSGLASIEKMVPKDVRILKHVLILVVKNPKELLAALNDAFTPGLEYETNDTDFLWTTPRKLHTLIKTLVDAFNAGEKGGVMREARDLIHPKIIPSLEKLMKIIEHNFL